MENKLNQLALKQYAKKYADLLIEKLFSNKDVISGSQIIDEIPVSQVALLTLFSINKLWKLEINKLKSPFFNYESEEVQLKLKDFMNVLSRKIMVSKEDFVPLLEHSIEHTLVLIISPLTYYKDLAASYQDAAPNMDEVKDLQRFIKINNHMRDALLTAWASNLSGEELFNKAFEGLTDPPEDVAPLLNKFNELYEIDMSSIWIEEEGKPIAELEVKMESEVIIETEDVIEVEFSTIHTQFKEEKTEILADSLGFENTKTSLKSMLTINQKFMFINDLFDGSKEDFFKVIDFLDTCETKEVVTKFIQSNYIQRGNWKSEAPQVKEFFELVNKKFG